MLGIVLIICIVLYWCLQYKSYRLVSGESVDPVELGSRGRRFEVNGSVKKYDAWSLIVLLAAIVFCYWPFLFINNVSRVVYWVVLLSSCVYLVFHIFVIIFLLKRSKGYVRINDEEIEFERQKYNKINVCDIKKISYIGFYRFDIYMKEKGEKSKAIFIGNLNNRKELFRLLKELRCRVAKKNGLENKFSHKFGGSRSHKFFELFFRTVFFGGYSLLGLFLSVCCIDDEFNKRDYYTDFNAIGYDASQTENAWDYYTEAVSKYVDYGGEFEGRIKQGLKNKKFVVEEEQKKELSSWLEDNREALDLVRKATAIGYCYVEYDPVLESESHKEVDRIHYSVKKFYEVLRFGYYSGVFDYDLAEIFGMHLSTSRHCIDGRDLIVQLIGYGLLDRAVELIERSDDISVSTIESMRGLLAKYYHLGVPFVDFRGEKLSMLANYEKVRSQEIELPYNTPVNPVYLIFGSRMVWERGFEKMYSEIEDTVAGRAEMRDKSPFLSYPPVVAVFRDIVYKSLIRASYFSRVAGSSVLVCDVIFDLEEYKVKTGGYPVSMDELNDAGYEAQLPEDIDSDGNIIYLIDGSRAVLYGFGENGKDDGGYYDGKDDEGDRDDRIYWEKG